MSSRTSIEEIAARIEERLRDTPGESGESGENPESMRPGGWRNAGERWRISPEDGEKLKRRARSLLQSDTATKLPAYPLEALGEVLAPAAAELAEKGQVAPGMAGQAFLAAAALVAQGTANAWTLAGRRPLSLYLATVGASGDGKTTCDSAALRPIRSWQRELSEARERARKASSLDDFTGKKKRNRDDEEEEPEPWMLAHEATVEGLRDSFQTGRFSQGVFSSEGAALLHGYGMNIEHRQKTCAVFNSLWDCGEFSVLRSRYGAGRVHLYGKRLTVHLLIQPDAVRACLHDPALSSVGFWPRFLFAWPEPAPPRKAREFRPDRCAPIAAAWRRFTELLNEQPLVADADKLPVIEWTSDARKQVLEPAFERFDFEAKRGNLAEIKPFATRAAEIACRIAGIISVMDGKGQIDVQAGKNAISLVAHSLNSWIHAINARDEAEAVARAVCLHGWLIDHGGQASGSAMLRCGPRAHGLRTRDGRDQALAKLETKRLAIFNRKTGLWEVVVDG